MQKRPLEPLRILLKISLLFGLAYNVYFKAAEAITETSGFRHVFIVEGLTLDERMSKIEKENRQHRTEIFLFKTKLDNGINSISKLEAEKIIQEMENYVLKS